MNVEIGTEAAQFPEKEYIFGIIVAVKETSGKLPYTVRVPANSRTSFHPPGQFAQLLFTYIF
jgi:hypothetical protein